MAANPTTPWTCNDAGDQTGRTVLITGANTGIGYAAAKLLAEKGATVVLACRSPQKSEQALARLKAEVPQGSVSRVALDLANLSAVRECAASVSANYPHIDVLVNNAGLMMPPLQRTADGYEMQFGTHVLGHFALTGLLLPLLERAPAARVVWVSSVAHWSGRIDMDNLNAERGYGRWRAYAQSKLADLMLAYEMQRRLKRAGSAVITLGAHPGGSNTELSRNNVLLKVINAAISPFTQTPEDGAMPLVRAAVDRLARGGDYYGPGGWATMSGPPTRQRASRRVYDEAVAAKLWAVCERLTGVRWLN